MNWSEKTAAIVVGVVCLAVFTVLLVFHLIEGQLYAALIVSTMGVCLAIAVLPRLQELRFGLKEVELVLAKIEVTKAEIAQMYGGIEHLKRVPLLPEQERFKTLGVGGGGGFVHSGSVVNYVMGCMKRERERLAKIFITEKSAQQLAEALIDGALDGKVFEWVGPGTYLEKPSNSSEPKPS